MDTASHFMRKDCLRVYIVVESPHLKGKQKGLFISTEGNIPQSD
jgi:hypothetical protein